MNSLWLLLFFSFCFFGLVGSKQEKQVSHKHRHKHYTYFNNTLNTKNPVLVHFDGLATSENMQAMPPAAAVTTGTTQFSFILSETNIDNYEIQERDVFVEIKSIFNGRRSGRAPDNIMQNYKMITVRCDTLEITSVIDFNHKLVKISLDKVFIVVGFGDHSDILFDSAAAQTVISGDKNEIGNCGTTSCAVLLLHNKSKRELNEIILRKSMQNKFVRQSFADDQRMKTIIAKSTKDIIVYGKQNVGNLRCPFFDRILAENAKPNGNYILRDITTSTYKTFPSLNYCSDVSRPFEASSFEQGKSSRGSENVCTGNKIIQGNFENPVVRHVQPEILPHKGPTRNQITVRNDEIDNSATAVTIEVTPSVVPLVTWLNPYQKHYFKPEWKTVCRGDLPNLGRYEFQTSHVQDWLDVVVSESKCRFSCHACKKYFAMGYRVDVRSKKAIVSEQGYWSASPSANHREIVEHENDKIHVSASHFVNQLSLASNEDEFKNVIEAENNNQETIFKATSNIIKTVYTMVKANIPFSQLPRIMILLQNLEVSVGVWHHNEVAAQEIATTISDSFHKKLLNSLIINNKRFTLLCDESTDRTHLSYLIVYLQTLEDMYPITYYYGLIPLSDGQSSSATFNKFQEQIEQDDLIVPGFKEYFKSHIALLVTDNANVMVGEQNSFFTKLNEYIKPNRISNIGCLAHTIELVMMWSINRQAEIDPRFKYLQKFQAEVNRFYTYFLSRGSKRWGHYLTIARELDLSPKKLKYVYATRWADARFQAMTALHENYENLKPVLISIDENESFKAEAQSTGRDLYELLQDQSFSIVLREFLDFLTVYKELSLKFQQSASILLGKADFVESAYVQIQDLKLRPGKFVQNFLDECECRYGCQLSTCTIVQYDLCNEIVHKGYTLEKVNNNRILLSQVRGDLYDYMLIEMNRYLNIDILVAVQLFDNRKFIFKPPTSGSQHVDLTKPIRSYYSLDYSFFKPRSATWKLEKLCEFYNIDFESDCINLARDWKSIIHFITTDTFIWSFKDELPEKFWPIALVQTRIPWTSITRHIIELMLVSGNNDAISERGFSIMDFTKSKSRAQLSPKTLSDLIRIRENGPENLNDLNINEYTGNYLKFHKRADEERNLGGRQINENNFESFFKKSRLF